MTNPVLPRPEREQTDESLRLERDRADGALDDEVSEADETADAVISRARARADALLAAARTKTDQSSTNQPTDALETSRAMEDSILHRERVTADRALRRERSEHVTLLSEERQATDHDLSHERARSDNALAMRDDFMGIVSHDLLNLLNAMVGISSLIEKEVAQEDHVERVVAHARRVQRSGARMRRLVGDLVDVASIEAGMLAVTQAVGDPADVVTEAVETFQAEASRSGISLTAEIVPGVPSISLDAARILQVLCNLLNNALKFTPAQGSIVVRLERVDNDVVCSVSDTGEGVPHDKLEAVFDRFVQLTKMTAEASDSVFSFRSASSRVTADESGLKTGWIGAAPSVSRCHSTRLPSRQRPDTRGMANGPFSPSPTSGLISGVIAGCDADYGPHIEFATSVAQGRGRTRPGNVGHDPVELPDSL